MKKNNKQFALFGVIALCIAIAGGVFAIRNNSNNNQEVKQVESSTDPVAEVGNETTTIDISDIETTKALSEEEGMETTEADIPETTIPETTQQESTTVIVETLTTTQQETTTVVIKPTETTTQTPTTIPLTQIEEKPTDPPETTSQATGETHEIPDDPILTNPDVMPDSTPVVPETTVTVETAPSSGSTNENGEIYIPGFGWVPNEGGGGQGEQSQLDPEHTDFDNIIGY